MARAEAACQDGGREEAGRGGAGVDGTRRRGEDDGDDMEASA